jgi:lysophospholipase L1-like esterase
VDTGELAWLPAWATTNQRTEDSNEPPPLADTTLRQFVWPSYSGSEIRLQLSNQRGELPVVITKVHVAKAVTAGTSDIDVATDVELTWGGEVAVTIPVGETVWSDPIAFDLVEMTQVAVTMHFTSAPLDVTGHPGARTTSFIGAGDVVADATIAGETRDRWYFIQTIETMAPADAYSIAILGDSITDGYGILNEFARWPDFLNRSINKDAALQDKVSVLNFGMGANNLTVPGTNEDQDPGTVRFERDVLGRADKIRWLIVFIGVNDMIYSGVTAEAIIAAYEDIIERSHAEGIAVYGATITPFESHTQGDPLAIRDAVNAWVLGENAFDAVIDFAAAVADPRKPSQLNPGISNDGLHPNQAGYEVLADNVDLSLFYTTLQQ